MDEVESLTRRLAPRYGSAENDLSFFDNPQLRLEDVMTLLDNDFRLFSQSPPSPLRLNESDDTRTLKELIGRTLDYALMGPPCRRHIALAEAMRPGDVVLSLNYDVLLDNALYDRAKISDTSYSMNFFKTNVEGSWSKPDDNPSEVALLKLHGSLNWMRCGLCGILLLYRSKKQTLSGALPFLCPRCSAGNEYVQRMMVPPVQSKDYRDRDIAFLWIRADRLTQEFSRIISIGSSCSTLDSEMISLLRRFKARAP